MANGFPYYGGKLSHLSNLLPLLPTDARIYCEPFAGSGSVLLNREPATVEVFNDADEEVYNFFTVLRDHREELIERLEQTPHHRREFEECVRARADPPDDPVERARCWFVRLGQGYGRQPAAATEGRWSRSGGADRAGLPERVRKWQVSIERLDEVANRLRDVEFECTDALNVIEGYDAPDALMYCDPPYVAEEREAGSRSVYAHEMTRDDHRAFCKALTDIEGRAAVSGYDSDIYRETLDGDGWYRTEYSRYVNISRGERKDKMEVVWTNYPIPESGHVQQATLEGAW